MNKVFNHFPLQHFAEKIDASMTKQDIITGRKQSQVILPGSSAIMDHVTLSSLRHPTIVMRTENARRHPMAKRIGKLQIPLRVKRSVFSIQWAVGIQR